MTTPISNMRLGVSSQILPFSNDEIVKYDYVFNKFVINTAQSALKGLAFGLAASLFFKRKGVIFYSVGFGLGTQIMGTNFTNATTL